MKFGLMFTEAEKELLFYNLQLIADSLTQKESCSSYKIILHLVPIVGIVFGSLLLYFIFYWWHKQRIELIKANMHKPIPFDIRVFSFFVGLLLTFIGLGLSIVFVLILGNSMAILGGIIPLSVGLGLITFYKFYRE